MMAANGPFAAAVLGTHSPKGVTTSRGRPDPARFNVYRNNVSAGLTGALASRYPVAHAIVGDAFFRQMATAFIATSRPSSPVMLEYGDRFPDFVSDLPGLAGVPYLPDVMRIERAASRAYHAADMPPLLPVDLAKVSGGELGETRLVAHPAASLIVSMFPAGSIWSAHQPGGSPSGRWSGSEAVLVTRPGLEVGAHVLPAGDAGFASALLGGASLESAAASAIAASDRFDFGSALVGLLSLGAFCAIVRGEISA